MSYSNSKSYFNEIRDSPSMIISPTEDKSWYFVSWNRYFVSMWINLLFLFIEYIFAALPRTQRGTPLVLGGDPKGRTFLYTNGNSVIIRDIENPAIADVYTEHSCQVNVAKYSPSGFYIASGG